ncbi:MAG: SdpI family protein [Oscillibacter sp.]|nr:SdpI family protein [Oscillibacter sp.]
MFIYWWSTFLIPLLMVLLGLLFSRFPPKKINGWAGYRTSRSMKSQEAWDFANAMAARLMWQTGLAYGTLAFLLMRSFRRMSAGGQGILSVVFELIEVAGLVLLILPVERALKENFDECGVPKKRD